MKKPFLYLLIVISTLTLSCNNQIKTHKKSNETKISMIKETTPINSIDFFLGKWELKEKRIDDKVVKSICTDKSTWEFIKKGNLVLQKKSTIHHDCKTKSSTKLAKANFKSPNGLYYFIDDTGFYVTVTKVDNDSIIITEKEAINGKIVNIRYYYKRVK